MPIDLNADVVTLTAALVDIASESLFEQQIVLRLLSWFRSLLCCLRGGGYYKDKKDEERTTSSHRLKLTFLSCCRYRDIKTKASNYQKNILMTFPHLRVKLTNTPSNSPNFDSNPDQKGV